jgi:hypothetical protein
MQYVRLVKPGWFDHTKEEFSNLTFKKSGDGTGMSVLEMASITTGIMEHVRKYYPGHVINDQVVFCLLEERDLPKGWVAEFIEDPENPDPHHRCLDAIVDPKGTRISKKAFVRHFDEKLACIERFSICEADGSIRAATVEDVAEWERRKDSEDAASSD